jgi:hypothetical protein
MLEKGNKEELLRMGLLVLGSQVGDTSAVFGGTLSWVRIVSDEGGEKSLFPKEVRLVSTNGIEE